MPLSLNCTGFTGTLAGSGNITTVGSVTFVAGMTITATGTLDIRATCTLTSGGKTWTGTLSLSVTGSTKTLADNWTVAHLTLAGTNQILSGFTLYVQGYLTMTAQTSTSASNNTVIELIGTGIWSGNQDLRNPLIINTTGTITVSGNVALSSTEFTYVTGTFTMPSSSFIILGLATFTCGNMTGSNRISNIQMGGATLTLAEDLFLSGNLTCSGNQNNAINGASRIVTVDGSLSSGSMTTTVWSGTALINLVGTGSISSPSFTTGRISLSITVTSTGNYSFGTNFQYGGGTFIIESGATFSAAGFTLTVISANTTLNFNGSTLYGLTVGSAGITITLSSELKVSGAFTVTVPTAASSSAINSDVVGTQRKFTLLPGATQSINFLNVTDIDSSRGQRIYSWRGTLSNTTNWTSFNTYTRGVGYVNIN